MDLDLIHEKEEAIPDFKIVRDSNETSFRFILGDKLAFVQINENKLFKVNPKDRE